MDKTQFDVQPGKKQITLTRTFDAPRELVFRAFTDPALISQWWGPRRLTTVVERLEARPGGAWRFVQHDREGNEFAFNGVYREVVPLERLVYTFEFEGEPGHIIVEAVTLEDLGGKTRVTAIDTFETAEDLQGMLQSGMQDGASESYDRLEELAQALQAETNRGR